MTSHSVPAPDLPAVPGPRAPVLVVGSVGLDDVETPFGAVQEELGGSSTFFSASASLFAPVRVVSVVGEDLAQDAFDFLARRGVDLAGLARLPGRTFRWAGRYGFDLNSRETLRTELNVYGDFHPRLPDHYRRTPYVFLANIHPALQIEVLQQVERGAFVALDTMDFWIEVARDALEAVLARVDMVSLNDSEARELAGTPNLVTAARRIQNMGPRAVLIKKGEHGALCFNGDAVFFAPAYPLEEVRDPTGAGDVFAGGVMGYLAEQGGDPIAALRRAVIYGSAVASFAVEDFGCRRLRTVQRAEVEVRCRAFRAMTAVDGWEG